MSQYTPFFHSKDYPELNRRITTYEYNQVVDEAIALGLTDGFMQEKSSAREEYTPPFDLRKGSFFHPHVRNPHPSYKNRPGRRISPSRPVI